MIKNDINDLLITYEEPNSYYAKAVSKSLIHAIDNLNDAEKIIDAGRTHQTVMKVKL